MRQKFVIQGRLPGANELMGRRWQASYSKKREAKDIVMWEATAARIRPVKRLARVKIACFEKDRRRDQDNVVSGAAKVIFDALVECGILRDDAQRYVRYIPVPVEIDRDNPRVEVEIDEQD